MRAMRRERSNEPQSFAAFVNESLIRQKLVNRAVLSLEFEVDTGLARKTPQNSPVADIEQHLRRTAMNDRGSQGIQNACKVTRVDRPRSEQATGFTKGAVANGDATCPLFDRFEITTRVSGADVAHLDHIADPTFDNRSRRGDDANVRWLFQRGAER